MVDDASRVQWGAYWHVIVGYCWILLDVSAHIQWIHFLFPKRLGLSLGRWLKWLKVWWVQVDEGISANHADKFSHERLHFI